MKQTEFPPHKNLRDTNGLIETGVNYIFRSDGSVDWAKMVPENHVYINEGYFTSRDLELPASLEGLDDQQKIIKHTGLRELARIRGYNSVNFNYERINGACICKCSISWLPNYETNHKVVTTEDLASVSPLNADEFAYLFAESIAANRAFNRCVRNFLGVYIVSDEEIGIEGGSANKARQARRSQKKTNGQAFLESAAQKKLNVSSFEEFKKTLEVLAETGQYKEDTSKWTDWTDIPAKQARLLMELVNKM